MIVALGVTVLARGVRSQEDLVNTVELSAFASRPNPAAVSFELSDPEPRADVLIVGSDGEQVRALALGEPLAAGRQEFSWNLRTDDGTAAPPGTYRLRVILGSEDRDIEPPGTIEIVAPDELSGE